ncbi:hypothetical protein [uncultured Methylobacterium sp.]|uniref:hypothetical protein n=1 Tax=uncultured Methylobacterium sp. TaxID=157278 RepID=UPI0035C9B645
MADPSIRLALPASPLADRWYFAISHEKCAAGPTGGHDPHDGMLLSLGHPTSDPITRDQAVQAMPFDGRHTELAWMSADGDALPMQVAGNR